MMAETGGVKIDFVRADPTKEQDIVGAWETVLARHGQVNLLIMTHAPTTTPSHHDTSNLLKHTIETAMLPLVNFAKLFLAQQGLRATLRPGEYQFVNLNSFGATLGLA